jgi:hypothetical protein
MSFTINANFLANARPVAHLRDGSKVVYSQGKFDAWCIYHVGNSVADATKDVDFFTLIRKYTDSCQRFKLYKDFLYIFDKVTNVLNYDVVENIKNVAKKYPNSGEVELILIFLYAGMVAEKNKDKAIFKKYIKRLCSPSADRKNTSRNCCKLLQKKNWRELKLECEASGFTPITTKLN